MHEDGSESRVHGRAAAGLDLHGWDEAGKILGPTGLPCPGPSRRSGGLRAEARADELTITSSHAATETADPPFRPAWWAPTGLLQTLAGQRRGAAPPSFRSEVWPTPDGDELRVHFVDVPDASRPTVLLLHGLEGSRESAYVAEAAARTAAAGWRFCVLEFRSCGGVLNRARRTYHSGETTDTALVAAGLRERFPGAPLFVLGYSLGANVLLKWLAERGADSPVTAAAAISPPFDLDACSRQCDSRYGGAIARRFLRTLVPKAIAKERQHPGLYDVDAVRRCRTFRAFDDLVTAPTHGFEDAEHYYRTQSCGPLLPAIRRPALVIAAADDPLSRPEVIPRATLADSEYLTGVLPGRGGHVAFVAGGTPWRPRRWAEALALRFFASLSDAPRG